MFILTSAQLEYIHNETKPRWDLDPPQREEYENDYYYMIALGQYADRCIKMVMLERLGHEKV